MSSYCGRDGARPYRLREWQARIGKLPIASFTDDDFFHALEAVAAAPARIFTGYDADGKPIHRLKGGPRAHGTINRFHDALAAVVAWAIKRRRVPRGFENPVRKVDKRPEHPGVVRFLSAEERERLLSACKASAWPRLYGLVLLALTSGARRGELGRLRWRDINF